jgi:multiple sugar transport system permease protein
MATTISTGADADLTPTAPSKPPASVGRRRGWPATPYLFLAPFLLIFLGFVLAPAIYGIWISLHDYSFTLPNQPWVGLQNYIDLFTSGTRDSENFWDSMSATGIFTVGSVPFLMVCPLAIALLLNAAFPGRTFFRAVFFAPYVLGVAVVGVLFRFMLDPTIGIVNFYLHKLGVDSSIPWITQLPWAWISLISMTVWWTLGFNAIIYLAGLQDISPDLYEAARVDGANKWQQFRFITIPGLRPVLLFIFTITILNSANMFGQAYLVTQGAPGNSTRTALMYIAQVGLGEYRQGMAAAMSYILALILIIISLINFRVFRPNQEA